MLTGETEKVQIGAAQFDVGAVVTLGNGEAREERKGLNEQEGESSSKLHGGTSDEWNVAVGSSDGAEMNLNLACFYALSDRGGIWFYTEKSGRCASIGVWEGLCSVLCTLAPSLTCGCGTIYLKGRKFVER